MVEQFEKNLMEKTDYLVAKSIVNSNVDFTRFNLISLMLNPLRISST